MFSLPARPSLVVLPLVLLATLACSGEGTPAVAPEAAPAPETPAAPPAEPAPALRVNGKPTQAAFNKAYADHFQTQAAINQPFDAKLAAFVAQVGTPPRLVDGVNVWYAVDAEGACRKIELSEMGLGAEKIFDAAVAQAECGIAPAVE